MSDDGSNELDPVLYDGYMGSLSLPRGYEVTIVLAGSFQLIERRRRALGARGAESAKRVL